MTMMMTRSMILAAAIAAIAAVAAGCGGDSGSGSGGGGAASTSTSTSQGTSGSSSSGGDGTSGSGGSPSSGTTTGGGGSGGVHSGLLSADLNGLHYDLMDDQTFTHGSDGTSLSARGSQYGKRLTFTVKAPQPLLLNASYACESSSLDVSMTIDFDSDPAVYQANQCSISVSSTTGGHIEGIFNGDLQKVGDGLVSINVVNGVFSFDE